MSVFDGQEIEEGRDKAGRFTEGNELWRLNPDPGPSRAYETAADLGDACLAYFEWAKARVEVKNKTTPFSQNALCLFLGISKTTWENYRKKDDLKEMCAWAEMVIEAQQWEGAVLGIYHGNIIARTQGLADKKTHGGDPENPIVAKITRQIVRPKPRDG